MLEFRRILMRRFGSLFRKRKLDEDLDQELRSHLDLAIEANLGRGMNAEEARRQALRSFGGIEQTKEIYREQRGFPMVETLLQDVRYGLRMLAQNPGFTAIAVLSLALGIGANTAIYSFMDAILLRALPVQHPEQLVALNWRSKDFPGVAHSFRGNNYRDPVTGFTSGNQPYPAFELLRADNRVFSSMFAFNNAGSLTVTVAGHAELADGQYVSGGYFSGLGVPAAAGRLIGDDDDRIGAAPVVAISYNFWRRRFASNPAAVGLTIVLNNTPCTIVGVSAPEFFGVSPGGAPDLFIPLHAMPNAARFAQRNSYWVLMMGRLRPGISISRAQAELSPLYHRFVADSATNAKERTDLPALLLQEGRSGIDVLRRRYSKPLYVLMAVVGLLLAIACANVANLLLSRASARRREIAVRLSLGAGRLRVIRQLLTESLLLGLAGGLLGALVAAPCIRFIEWLLANGREDFRTGASLDWQVLGFTLALALLTSVMFGLAPAIQATRVDLTPALKETRAGAPRAHALNPRMLRGIGLGRMLVISQIAISLLLVVAAGLFVRTLSNLESISLGFNRRNVLLFSMQARQAGYQDKALVRLYEELRTRFASIPGVLGASLSDYALVSGGISRTGLKIPSVVNPPGRQDGAAVLHVGAGFFSTMQIPILLGREIGERDNTEAPHVAVVNEVFAKKYFGVANPIGRRFGLGGDANKWADIEIVGVSRTARYDSLKEDIQPIVYIPYSQDLGVLNYMVFELRTSGDPLSFVSAVRRIANEVCPRVPVFNVTTQSAQIDRTIGQERTFAELCTCFAVLALAIACVGLYGSMAYAVSRRTNEIGIRMALGAERARIIRMVLREVFALSAVGLAIGLAAAWGMARFVESFLFGMKARDPLALSLSAAILIASAIAAGYGPAWRASRIDPMDALRHE